MEKCGEGHGGGEFAVRGRGQAGLSLIEALVAVAVLAIAMGGITAGVLVAIRASGDNAARTLAEHALNDITEDLKTAPYAPCASTTKVSTAVAAAANKLDNANRFTVRVDSVRYWRSSATPAAFAAGPCTTSPGPNRDSGAQRVLLTVTVGRVAVHGGVVLRNPGATP